MTAEQFNVVLESRIGLIRETLQTKAAEYATDDRLYNFKSAAQEFGGTPQQVLWGYLTKHLVSVRDMVMAVRPLTPAAVTEKIGDSINYLILLEGLFHELFQMPATDTTM